MGLGPFQPNCGCCGGGGGGHARCGCANLLDTLLVDIPGLSVTNLPLVFGGFFGGLAVWQGCVVRSVLGYALCSHTGTLAPGTCTLATVSVPFLVSLICSGAARGTLVVDYACYGNSNIPGCESSINSNTPSRGIDGVCGTGCSGNFPADIMIASWAGTLSCTRPTSIVYTGAPTVQFQTLSTSPFAPQNLYFGTGGATVHE